MELYIRIGDFMRKIRRKREKRKKRIIIISVFLFLIIMTSSYAAFQTNIILKVKGNIMPTCKIGEITINTVTEGDGLYKDEYENEKCIYKNAFIKEQTQIIILCLIMNFGE